MFLSRLSKGPPPQYRWLARKTRGQRPMHKRYFQRYGQNIPRFTILPERGARRIWPANAQKYTRSLLSQVSRCWVLLIYELYGGFSSHVIWRQRKGNILVFYSSVGKVTSVNTIWWAEKPLRARIPTPAPIHESVLGPVQRVDPWPLATLPGWVYDW